MKCKHIVGLFDSYLQGTATAQERQALESHIATCEDCRKKLQLYQYYFSDATVESDFPVPHLLNAKIRYAVHQNANQQQKVPFWQNKRILSVATACACLLVVGILGTTQLDKMKQASDTPAMTANQPQGFAANSKIKTAQPTEQAQEPSSADIQTAEETDGEIPAYNTRSGKPDILYPESTRLFQTIPRSSVDVVIAKQLKDTVLDAFSYEALSDNTYVINATKQELESVLGCSVNADATKNQLTIQFKN